MTGEHMAKLFFSYSHRDEAMRDELDVHLTMLKREDVIATWHDRRIVAGSELNGQISDELETADIVVLLVSPYFLDSDYCYDVEMSRAMQRHEEGTARVILVILEPCEWQRAPFGKLLATPEDGRPISKFPNIHDAFLQVTKAIRAAAGTDAAGKRSLQAKAASLGVAFVEPPRSSNLRLKKTFSERDRDRFRDETFEYIASFFQQSLLELESRNSSIETDFKRIDTHTFTAIIYKNGESCSECAISIPGSFGKHSIVYSSDKSSRGNSFNNMLSIVDDGTSLGLSASKNFGVSRSDEQLTQQGAAESFWAVLMSPLQR
jgi:hypothetical protein